LLRGAAGFLEGDSVKNPTPVRIGITPGDPAGVGPEVIAAALQDLKLPAGCEIEVLACGKHHSLGKPTPDSAKEAFDALETAAQKLVSGEWQAVVTGPVCKRAMHEVGFDFPGQTEFFACRAGVENFAMCLTGGSLTVALVTAHVPLARVAGLLCSSEILRVGKLLADFLRARGIARPRIAVAGLNPHAGENGDLGREEIEIIAPAVEELKPHGDFQGPFAPDTVFHRAVEGEFDGVLCMYHDQGLIPLKLHAFHEGVNVTLGLPFVRTSPDHGTAFEIAGRGIARADSMKAAIHLAAELASVVPSSLQMTVRRAHSKSL
jgi:4-hydroxythreonine-4-phosphate dehydrogenase